MAITQHARRWWPIGALAAGLLVIGLLAQGGGGGTPLDPTSARPLGAKALVLLLREYGVDVRLDNAVPGPGVAIAVVLDDQMDTARRERVSEWVFGGGRLVVADPTSLLQVGAATPVTLTGQAQHPTGPCGLPGLDNIRRLDVGPSEFLRAPESPGCFGEEISQGARAGHVDFLVDARNGSGQVIGLGGADVWANERLDHDDNAALALDLLAGAPQQTVDVLIPSPVGNGKQSVLSLLHPRLKLAAFQLLVAFGALVWWKGRRLGRPVAEPQPVQLAGSEIVVAVGELLGRTDNREAAAAQLRAGTRRRLGERVGAGSHPSPELLADVLWARAGVDRARSHGLLADGPVDDDASLVRLAQSLAQLRQEVIGG